MKTLCLLTAALLTGTAQAAEPPPLKYMERFSQDEALGRHVRATSLPVPKDFVDGQWEGIIAASDGYTYFSVSSHSPDHSGQFYRYHPEKGKVEHLIDIAKWCGEEESVGTWNAQGKMHSQIFEIDGKLYGSTTPAHMDLTRPYAGGHFLSYDLKTGEFRDLGVFPDTRGGLLTMHHEPVRQRLYAISQGDQTLCYYDLKSGEIVRIGSCQENPHQTRVLLSDARGRVYGCDWGYKVWRFDPADGTIAVLPTRLPHDPEAPQPKEDPKSLAWCSTTWKIPVWDPVTRWHYAVLGNDEYLFRMRLPAGDEPLQVEGLAQVGYRPSAVQPRFGSLSLTRRDRTLWYVSYPIWKSMAHLMSYQLDTGTVTNHGPLTVDGQRRVAEIHAMTVGSDGKLHAVAMVWSLAGSRDPAQPWANRASCYFHARLVTIDPPRDLHPASFLAEAPTIAPVKHEYLTGLSLAVYGAAKAESRPAIVFIHGGGWGAGYPEQFEPHARWFAGQGLVAVTVQYRLTRQEGVTVADCVDDVHAAIAWLREHAAELGIDPARIAVAGDSAGGHLAATCGTMAPAASRGNALILYNPVIDTASEDGWKIRGATPEQALALSPAHHVAAGSPPVLLLHGEADTVVPIRWAERYVEAMAEAGNTIEFIRLADTRHAFVIPNYGPNATIDYAMEQTAQFLRRQGYLKPRE